MSTFSNGLRRLRCQNQLARAQWPQPALQRPTFQLSIRTLNTESASTDASTEASTEAFTKFEESAAAVKAIAIPFQGVKHVRAIPSTPSYFSRDRKFNDLYIQISQLLTKYHHLPTISTSEAPPFTWMKLKEMRDELGEPIKAAHYAKVLRVAKRLHLIEPSLMPDHVTVALERFKRTVNPYTNMPKPITVDAYGRAVGVGKRKESTARAWVVEGTGEVLVNGKTLSEAFGRVHDRESAIWALQATQRLDKYNVWALVEGGGVTGQAEAITLAVAKALIAHEPALKKFLRQGKFP